MFARPRFLASLACLAALVSLVVSAPVPARAAPELHETAFWQAEVDSGDLPPVAERVPSEPLIVDLAAKGRTNG